MKLVMKEIHVIRAKQELLVFHISTFRKLWQYYEYLHILYYVLGTM